jgi:hypothetical protein
MMQDMINKIMTRLVVTLLLMMVVGVSKMYAQETPDYSGTYFIANGKGYSSTNIASNYYLVPATNANYESDAQKPHLTTSQTGQVLNCCWRIEKSGNYYHIIHVADGKYLTANPKYDGTTENNVGRLRVHLETMETPDDNTLFEIKVNSKGEYNIRHKDMVDVINKSTATYLDPAGGNVAGTNLTSLRSMETTSGTVNVGGGIGYWTDEEAARWRFEDVPQNNTYTYNIVDRQGRIAIKYTTSADQPAAKALSSYTDIPAAIRSPYLSGETVKFYTFSGDYDVENLSDENKILATPVTDNANIYVTYTTDHLSEKFLKLRGARAFNITESNKCIYDNNGELASEATDYTDAVTTTTHLWNFTGNDPYAVQIKNLKTGKFLVFSSGTTLSLADAATHNFILMEESAAANADYESVSLMAATGTETSDDTKKQVNAYPVSTATNYYLIDKANKVIFGPEESTSSELAIPEAWVSPLVSQYHYWKDGTLDGTSYDKTGATEISSPFEVTSGGNIYVTYDVSDAVTFDTTDDDAAGSTTYMLRFLHGHKFYQEDGVDGVMDTDQFAVYPYSNGDANFYVYGRERWEIQVASGASTRPRWLWYLVSPNSDPYHVKIMSYSAQGKSASHNYFYTHVENFGDANHIVTGVTTRGDRVTTGGVLDVGTTDNPKTYDFGSHPQTETEYMVLGSTGHYKLVTVNEITASGIADHAVYGKRRVVDSFEQYWKTYDTAKKKVLGITTADNADDPKTVPSEYHSTLEGKGWHRYNAWANAKQWNGYNSVLGTAAKDYEYQEHWFQTINMGDGEFVFEPMTLAPQVILLDQHGWEIMRTPLYNNYNTASQTLNTEGLRKFDSPMVEEYQWYPTAVKETGYHKYKDLNPEIKIYKYAQNTSGKYDWIDSETKYTNDEGGYTFTSTTLADSPYNHITTPSCEKPECTDPTHNTQPAKVMSDFYVTYTVKPAYTSNYQGAATEDAVVPSTYLVKQGGNYAKYSGSGSTIGTESEKPDRESTPNNILWNLKPNFNIDREMGYKYAGETGAQDGAKSQAATEQDNFDEGRNGFDPYNVQIQNKAYPLRYFTTNATASALSGGTWTGTSSSAVTLLNLGMKHTATGYDQTTLNITNATFMVVADANGNMRLMPRFDHSKVMQSFGSLETQAAAASAGDQGTGKQTLFLELVATPKEIHSSSEITDMNGNYLLAEDFSFESDFETLNNFTGIIDGQLHPIQGTLTKPLVNIAKNDAIIRNVILEEVSIEADGSVGAICCTAKDDTRIYNCGILSGSVKSKGTSSNADGTDCCGGLVGLLDGTSRVINCYSYATIKGGNRVGGIVGYNKGTTKAGSINTMVMNCMFYGDIEGGNKVSPIYGGNEISNLKHASDRKQDGLTTFNYYSYENLKSKDIDFYNCALAVEEKYLNRFEYYRLLLNSNKKLAAWYATGSVENGGQMAKWVLETADRTITNPKPYPVLKAQGYYPSIVNIDADNAPSLTLKDGKPKEEDRKKGGKLGTLSITIRTKSQKTDGGQSWPSTADVQTTSLPTVVRTDMDEDRFNFNYDKIQLPYYNDVGTGNYTENRVVTGWKITDITTLADDPYTASNYDYTKTYAANKAYFDYPNYNFADRKSSNKDKYSVSGRVFSQGAYFDVPYGVTSITIEPYWAKAAYIADPNYDVVYNTDYGNQNVSQTGTQVGSSTKFDGEKLGTTGQVVKTSISDALTYIKDKLGGYGSKVYDNAVVLVGNFHQAAIPSNGTNPFTMMSVDIDKDNEPDYSMTYHHTGKLKVCPIRFDFLNIPGAAQAQKPNGADKICNMAIIHPSAWFEITNTSSIYFSQLEYEDQVDNANKTEGPLILQGGIIDQIVSANKSPHNGKTIYVHVGGNVWFKEFNIGIHGDGSNATAHVPVSVTGGDYESFYLTGIYNQDASVKTDNAECYISGGHFKEVAGAGQEAINGSVRWQIYDADIDNFFGGGTNGATGKNIKGDVTVDIFNSHVTTFCGGPKFGNMESGKKVTTTADGCVFGKYFGAGYGGTAYSRKKYYDQTDTQWTTWEGKFTTDRGNYFDGSKASGNALGTNGSYGYKGIGVATDFDYEFFVWSSGATGGRFYVKFASFSLAQCNEVKSELTNCTINENFYGGGKLGKVAGNVTSVLDGCTVKGNVFGAGFSASMDPVLVRNGGFGEKKPNYNKNSGMFEPADWSGTTPFTWKQVTNLSNNGTGVDESGSPKYVYTTVDLSESNLGSVAGNVTLTLKGDTKVGTLVTIENEETHESVTTLTSGTGNVFGGGEQSYVTKSKDSNNQPVDNTGNTTVNLQGNTEVLGNVYGGGNEGVVEGSTEVNIMYPPKTTTTTPEPEPGGGE